MVDNWSVEIQDDDGSDVKAVPFSNFAQMLAYIKDFKAKGSAASLRVHARAGATDEERDEVIAAGAVPMWPLRRA